MQRSLQKRCRLFNQATFPNMIRSLSYRLSKTLHTFRELLMLIMWNVLLVCFWEYYKLSNDLEPFYVQYCSPANTFVCTQVQKAAKMSVGFARNFIMKMKGGFSVLLARYGSMKNVLKNNLSANFIKDMWLSFRC